MHNITSPGYDDGAIEQEIQAKDLTARENAITNIWPLMGYELRCKLSNA